MAVVHFSDQCYTLIQKTPNHLLSRHGSENAKLLSLSFASSMFTLLRCSCNGGIFLGVNDLMFNQRVKTSLLMQQCLYLAQNPTPDHQPECLQKLTFCSEKVHTSLTRRVSKLISEETQKRASFNEFLQKQFLNEHALNSSNRRCKQKSCS